MVYMQDWIQIGALFVAICIAMGTMFKFMWSRIDRKFDGIQYSIQCKFDGIERRFDNIERRFDNIDRKFESLLSELKEIRISIQELELRVGRLETQDEERFRNEIKLLVSERKQNNNS